MTTRLIIFAIVAISMVSILKTSDAKTIVCVDRLGKFCTKGPISSPAPRGPVEYFVGDALGWKVTPAGEVTYRTWSHGKTLVFNFADGTQDVALVTKENLKNCNTKETIFVESTNPVKFLLNATGLYHFTSTYKHHCAFGQKLAIHVTSATSSSPSGLANGPSSGHSSIAPAPHSSAHHTF